MSKKEAVESLIKSMQAYAGQDLAVAFSGGVDSSLLLYLACRYRGEGVQVHGVILKTVLQTEEEIEDARQMAEKMGAVPWVLSVDDWEEAGILDNPPQRCYLCKKYMFQRLKEHVNGLGVATILEGTNRDDLDVYRPGLKAIRELGILSPLAEAGVTKDMVRKMAQEYHISTAHKPSAPCLATRFPYGTRLTEEKLDMVARGEAFLRELGIEQVRLRVHGDIARIETSVEDFPLLMEHRQRVLRRLKEIGYAYVTLDLQGFRSGSMDENMANHR